MRRVHKARIVPDHVPEGLTEKVICVKDLALPIGVCLNGIVATSDRELTELRDEIHKEIWARTSGLRDDS